MTKEPFTKEDQELEINEINVTPLVDVSLVLVLIFLVTSPFFIKNLIPVNLPKVVSMESENQENITVSVSPDEGFAVNETLVPKANLSQAIEKAMKDTGFKFILVRADERVPYGDVQDILKIGKKLNASRIAFGTTPKMR